MIEDLFPSEVVVIRATDEMADEPLHPLEEALALRMGAGRRREFALGRACARRALARLEVSGPVLRAEDRSPIWPEGVVGSLTHCDDLCAAAVARRGAIVALGLDAESDAPLRERVGERVCTPDERAHVRDLPALDPGRWEKLLFSAKEAFYKAYFALSGSFLGFQDVALRIDPEAGTFLARVLREDKPGPRRAAGRFQLAPPHVITAVTLRREELEPGR